MKKILVAILLLASMVLAFSSCGNKQVFDTTYTFDKAIITLPNGQIIEGKIDSWRDYDDGDQIQVKINGTVYLVHSSNVVLIEE